jgi:hypothetical protein
MQRLSREPDAPGGININNTTMKNTCCKKFYSQICIKLYINGVYIPWTLDIISVWNIGTCTFEERWHTHFSTKRCKNKDLYLMNELSKWPEKILSHFQAKETWKHRKNYSIIIWNNLFFSHHAILKVISYKFWNYIKVNVMQSKTFSANVYYFIYY